MGIVTAVVMIYAGLCGFLYVAQRSLIYFPTPASSNAFAEDLRVPSDGETIQVWKQGGDHDDAILYFGGNAEDVAHNSAQFASLLPDKTIYLVNYRGYGESTGSPSEAAILQDAQAVFNHVATSHASVSVMGRSLGSGVATYLAATESIDRLILVTPYDSMANLAQSVYPMFPVSILLKDRYDSLSRAGEIDVPTLMLIAGSDEVIPNERSKSLAQAIAPTLLRVETIPDAMHNTIHGYALYERALADFLR